VVVVCTRQPVAGPVLEALAPVADAVGGSIERARAETALACSQAKLEEEARIAAALARVAEEMFSSLDTPVILERLCQLTANVLGCDYSTTLLWRSEADAYAPVAFHGLTAGELAIAETTAVPRENLGALFSGPLGGDEVVEVPVGAGGRHVCIALRQGKDVVGVQVAGWRSAAEGVTARCRRIAHGIARVASMALANAHLVEELERVSRLKSEFVSTMSHELRTPLNVILGYAEMAQDPGGGVERERCLGRIETAGRELLELIESTLEIGRIEAGRATAELEPVALVPFCADLGRSCANLPRSAAVAFEWTEGVPDALVVTDPRKLAIVVRNLVGNALKFTAEGSVRVAVCREDGELVLRVADTGIGIRAEDQEAIFEMFRQADGSDSRRYGGTGLGLYIVRRFVQQLGGRVALQSAPGQGSVFTVAVPWRASVARAVDAA
jgi:signal transduction histidine kinase